MRKLKLMKTLLVAAGLAVGASDAWGAVEITETYDFGAFITANGTANLTTSGDGIAQSGTSAKVGTVKVINNLTAGGQTLDLKGRFAVDYQYNAGVQIRFMWRSSSNAYQHGLAGQWNGNGTADSQGAARFSVLNLKANDKITFTYGKKANGAEPYTCSASQLTGVAVDAALVSGTQYTVAADGNLDLYFTNNNFAISKIVIVTTGNETVSAPTAAITGANGVARSVTISAGTSDAGNDVTTYYTTDGSTPSTSSASFTTASQVVTVGEGTTSETTVTVKAMSVSSTSTKSAVTSFDVTVGTVIKLAAPTITLSGMSEVNGYYYKQYTFNAVSTGTYNSPTITLTPKFGNEAITSPYASTKAGTISVVASAEGYADSDAATLDVDGGIFQLKSNYDFTQDSYREGLSAEGNNITISGAGVQVYRIYDTNYIDGLTLSNTNFGFTKAQNYDTCKGLTPRWGSGNITINDWVTGGIAVLTPYVGSDIRMTTTGVFSFGGQINNNTFTTLAVYSPVTNIVGNLDCTSNYRSVFSSDIVVANGSAKMVKFKNHGSGTGDEYYKNWVLDINYGGNLVTTVRSDWYSFGVGSFTYGYTYSSDNGVTADNSNVWGTWFADNAESDVELTLSHVDGKLYVIGTVQKESKVYYMNYLYGDGTQTEDFTLNLSVDHSWIELESVEDATAVTAPAHPTAINAGNVGDTGYSTFTSTLYPLDLSGITGATAYYASAVDALKVKISSTTASVPAGEGLLLKGPAGTAVKINIADEGTAISGNKLVGCVIATDLSQNASYYVLVNNGGTAEFQCLDQNGATIPAGKAYLNAGNAGARLSIINNEETSISSVENVNMKNVLYYNLNGQRMLAPQKGLYIVNGKKVVLK